MCSGNCRATVLIIERTHKNLTLTNINGIQSALEKAIQSAKGKDRRIQLSGHCKKTVTNHKQ